MTDFIELDGECIAYTTAGTPSRQPIVLVHGLMSHRGVWARTIEALKDQHYCIAVDLLGFGDSSKPNTGDYSIQAQAERILKIADRLAVRQFMIVGHSMGAQIALYLSVHAAPGRVLKLASIAGVVTGKLSAYVRMVNMQLVRTGRYAPWVYGIFESMSGHAWFANWAFGVWFAEPAKMPLNLWAEDRRQAFNSGIAISAYEAYRSLAKTDLTPMLSGLNMPVLAIYGKEDGTVPTTDAHVLEKQAPQTKLVLIDRCGHFPMYENFDAYITPMKDFFNNQN